MPLGNNLDSTKQLVKLLLIGFSKAGKTHWCLEAANAGYNIILLDGDVARNLLPQPHFDKGRGLIAYFGIGDTVAHSVMGQTTLAMKNSVASPYLWNDSEGRKLAPSDELVETSVTSIQINKLCHRDILVIDSNTALVHSFIKAYCLMNGIQMSTLAEASVALRRDMYQAVGQKLSDIYCTIQAAPCHVVLLAHPAEMEKKKKPDGSTGVVKEKDMITEYTRLIPKSVSNPHGMTLAKHFTDVVWIEVGHMQARWIDGRAHKDKDGGGRFNDRKKATEYSLAKLIELAGGYVPGEVKEFDSPGVTYYAKGEYEAPGFGRSNTMIGNQNTTVKVKT